MISLAEINAAADKFQVPAETIEKDYIISWILLCLSKSKLNKHFIKSNWNTRLRKQMGELSNIDTVIKDIENSLEKLFNAYRKER